MTDLELMQLLDEQGYEATVENLLILKEGLESGEYEILEENELSDYELYQLLESEGYETTNENLEILKEGLYSGKIEILNEMRREAKEAIKKLKTDGKNANITKGQARQVKDKIQGERFAKKEKADFATGVLNSNSGKMIGSSAVKAAKGISDKKKKTVGYHIGKAMYDTVGMIDAPAWAISGSKNKKDPDTLKDKNEPSTKKRNKFLTKKIKKYDI